MANEEVIPRIVSIKPGNANEKSLREKLPDNMGQASVDEVVKCILKQVGNDPEAKRKKQRLFDRINKEMSGDYGLTVNSETVKPGQGIGTYFVQRESSKGQKYEEVVIVVAAENEGGYSSLEYDV